MVSDVSGESREVRTRIVADIPHVRNHLAAMGRGIPDHTKPPYAVAEKEAANLVLRKVNAIR